MRPPESFVGQPVRSLQTMLRVLSVSDPSYKNVIPDGIYGPETMQAVSGFQRRHALPVTGVTDLATWEAIVAAYFPALPLIEDAAPLGVVWNPGETVGPGQQHPNLRLAQSMLAVLAERYHSVAEPSQSGVLDAATADSLSSFQMLSSLPMTGQLDRVTWLHLTLQYPLAANHQPAAFIAKV